MLPGVWLYKHRHTQTHTLCLTFKMISVTCRVALIDDLAKWIANLDLFHLSSLRLYYIFSEYRTALDAVF